MACPKDTLLLASPEEKLTVLFCLVDDAYARLNPRARCYEALKKELAEAGVLLEGRAEARSALQQEMEVCFATLKGVFGLGETLVKTLVGLATRTRSR